MESREKKQERVEKNLRLSLLFRDETVTVVSNLGVLKYQMLLHLKMENHWQGLYMQPWLEQQENVQIRIERHRQSFSRKPR